MASASSAAVDVLDMAWELRCREEDMRQRSIENIRRQIDDTRREVDERAECLNAVSHLSALISGFAMVVMIEVQLPSDLHIFQITLFGELRVFSNFSTILMSYMKFTPCFHAGATSAGVVSLMLIAMLNCTMMLIAILRYDCVQRDPPFDQFWATRCEGGSSLIRLLLLGFLYSYVSWLRLVGSYFTITMPSRERSQRALLLSLRLVFVSGGTCTSAQSGCIGMG